MKGLYLKRNVWWMNFSVKGTSYQRSTGTNDKALAEKILEKIKAEIVLDVWYDRREKREAHTFKELAEKYKVWVRGRQKGFVKKEYRIVALEKIFGEFYLEEMTNQVIEKYQSERLSAKKKPATINRAVEIVRHMFTKAADWNMTDETTLKNIRKAKLLKMNNARLRYLSREESLTFIDCCDPHLGPIVQVALNTGMRRGEILSLQWKQVDLKHGFILLSDTKNGDRREIPINDTLRSVLQGLTRRLDVPHVFYDKITGKPFAELKHSFASACRRAKISDFKFHDLRHTFASHLVMAGVDIVTIKELLGHRDIKMTLRYAHLAPSHKVKAVQILDRKDQISDPNSDHFLTAGEKERGCISATP